MPTLLYYPMVKPPVEVLHHALLYWDDIASLVPGDPDVCAYSMSSELTELKDRGLYHPLDASTYRLNGQNQFTALMQELRDVAARQAGAPMSDGMVPLYGSKLQQALEIEILHLGLGRRLAYSPTAGDRRSLAVSREVQLLLMGALAHAAADSRERAYVLHTDQRSVQEPFLRSSPNRMNAGAWRVELGRLLPNPAPGTSTNDVLAFRERYADERERLIGATQSLLNDLRSEWEHPADIMRRMRVELARAREDYEAAAKGVRMAWVSRSVSVTIGIATAAAGALVIPDLAWVAGIAGSIGFNIATREIRPLTSSRKTHAFSYLHHVDRELA